jgi:hypothetical protein
MNISVNVNAYLYRPIDYAKIIKYIKKDYIYDNFNAERFYTSCVETSATPPTNYNYSFPINSSATGYVNISDIP